MDAERIKAFFFEAMNAGWASETKKESIPQLPGAKAIPYRHLDLYLLDYYFVVHGSRFSYGTTTIWQNENPVWVMHYGGWYDKRVIPFLKRCLRRNYVDNIFVGGRGPERLEGEDHTLQYLNRVENHGNFLNFKGFEEIITTSESWKVPVGKKMGEHHYFGGMLL